VASCRGEAASDFVIWTSVFDIRYSPFCVIVNGAL
jgi:hypothetical protein